MRKLVKHLLYVLSLTGAMLLVTELVLVIVLFFGGVITVEKVADVVKVLQGNLQSPPEPDAEAAEIPAPLEIDTEEELKQAVAAWKEEKKAQEESIAALRESLGSVRRELDRDRTDIEARWRDLEKSQAAFETARAAELAAGRDKGFQEAVKNYQAMDAKDVASLIYGLADEDVVRYLRSFKTPFTAEILTEIKKLDDTANASADGTGDINRAALLQEIIAGGNADPAAAATTAAN